jgi:mycothiol synthase
MNLHPRPFAGESDLRKLSTFLTSVNAGGSAPGAWHLGDLIWGIYQNTIFNPYESIRLWEDDAGTLLGFDWLDAPAFISHQLHPRVQGLLESEILTWAEQYARAHPTPNEPLELWTRGWDTDTAWLGLLEDHGFQRDEFHYLKMAQPLDRALPSPTLPDGWTVRPVGGEEEWHPRIELHRAVWHPSKVTLDAYRRLRTIPGYRPDLDFVVVAPDGTFAAYCICWHDPINQTAEFEPVGTHPDFQRRGLGKALLLTALHRLQALGVQKALVTSIGTNQASVALYQSVGFSTEATEHLYNKRLAP